MARNAQVTTVPSTENEQETVKCRTCVYIRTSYSVLLSHLLAQWKVEVLQVLGWRIGDVVFLPAMPPQ